MPKFQYRNEWKYVCHESDLSALEERIGTILEMDPNSGGRPYKVRSLYFDDYMDTCYLEKDAGTGDRYKYRIRYYGDSPDLIRFERKVKKNDRERKETCIISRETYDQILDEDYDLVLWETESPVLKFFCTRCMADGFRPSAIIDYDRTAYIQKDYNIRITVDRNICVSEDADLFLTGDYDRTPIQENDMHVLEVKFDEVLPSYIRHAAFFPGMIQSSFSKYALGRKMLTMKGISRL